MTYIDNATYAIMLVVLIISAIVLLTRTKLHKSIYVDKKDDADFWTGKRPPDDGFTHAQKIEIYKRDNGRCRITGKRVWFGEPDKHQEIENALRRLISTIPGLGIIEKQQGEIDHIIPRSMGGPSAIWNGMLVTREINRGKGGKFSKWSREAERLCHKMGFKVYLTDEEREKYRKTR